MKSELSFLIAARECEIVELEQLAQSCELVSVVGHLIHALQRERGLSNVFLGSRGLRLAPERLAQVEDSRARERALREHLDRLDTAARRGGHGARLFSRVAFVLHGLDELGTLRQRVGSCATTPAQATAHYSRVIAGLLAVVFEAADAATDPQISHALVALFNFMQGKEFSGQERACGSAVFAAGHADPAAVAHWRHLVEQQARCLELFHDFADDAASQAWDGAQPDVPMTEIERLRRLGMVDSGPAPDAGLSEAWFDACSRRIDAMHRVERALARSLRALCERKVDQARAELHDRRLLIDRLQSPGGHLASATGVPAPYGPQVERSILELVQEQAQRLQAMSDELASARAALHERKTVERAKGLLMATRRLSESDAHKLLRQTAMSQNRRMVDVAEAVLAMADLL